MNSPESERGKTGMVLLSMLPAWLATAWLVSKAQWFWNHRPDLQFGWIVLLLSAFVVWDRWEQRPPVQFQARWPFYFLAVGGLGVLFMAQIYHAAFGMMPALLMGTSFGIFAIIAANTHYVFGWAGLRFFAFPFLFLLVALPLPSVLQDPIVVGLQNKVAIINVEALNILGIGARRSGSVIHLPNGSVGVDEACSGIRSLQSAIMATLFIGYLSLRKKWLQGLLLICGVGIAIAGNLARSLFLSLAANSGGTTSVEQAHDPAGYSIMIFTAAGVGLAAWGLSKYEKWAAREAMRLRARADGVTRKAAAP